MKNMPLGNVTALITGPVSERQSYEGRGDARRVVGRATDAEGRPVSGANAVVMAPVLGMLANASVLVPDSQAPALVEGSLVALAGVTASLSGADYGQVRATVTGTTAAPIGTLEEAVARLAGGQQGDKSRG